jgi:predicted Zn-dependent peptidase
VIHRPGLPITSISATMLGGNLLEPADKIGVSALMAGLSGLSGSADRANQWRMGIEGDVGADSETVTMRQKMLSYYADEAFRLFAKEVQSPKYRRFTLVDAREAVANSYGEWDKRVQALSARAMWRHFGLQGVEPLPTKETVESIGLTDLWAQHARLAYPENTCLTIATDLDREQIDKLVNDYFGGWSSAGVPAVDLDALARPLAPTAEGTAIVIEAPTAKESSIVLALPAPGWKDWQEHLKAEMVAALIGEEVEHLREAMGITYGASASVASIRNQSLITLKSSVEAAKTDDAVDAVLRIVDKLRHTPISSDKVDFAKRNALAQFVGSGHTSDSAVKGHAQEMVRDLPRDHRRQAIEFISKVTRDDLQKTLDDLLGQAPTLVVAGKAPTLPDNRTGLLGAFTKVERYTPEQLTK